MSTVVIRTGSAGLHAPRRRPVGRGPAPWLGLALAASTLMWVALGVALVIVA